MPDHLIPKSKAQVYLVGGAVRDQLLKRPVVERDWVVVGGSAELMLAHGFRKVGKDFPVFLHPKSHEEYALARTERKHSRGYYGFEVQATPDITLQQDLLRRDLTINAIAQDDNGDLIDPYEGQVDLKSRKLRHISPAFREDPLRVLRVARLAARYKKYQFAVDAGTLALMADIAASGELSSLAAERVWQETVRALSEDDPVVYIRTLRCCGALKVLFPEVDALYGVPQSPKWHPEVDTGVHTELVMIRACQLSTDPCVRFAALCHDLGKGQTPKEQWPAHHGHEQRSAHLTEQLCKRLKPPRQFTELALHTAKYHGDCHKAMTLKPSTLLKKINALDALRRPERFEQFLIACTADAQGRPGFEKKSYPQANYMRGAVAALKSAQADISAQVKSSIKNPAAAANKARLECVKNYVASQT